MVNYTPQQRLEIVKIYYKNSESVRATFRALRDVYGLRNRPDERTILRIVRRFEASFTLHDQKPPIRSRTGRSNENIAAVRASVAEISNLSVPRSAQALRLSTMTTWRILRKDLGLHPYKIVLTQELKPPDHRMRRTFADWALERLENDADFHKKIIFSDEAHFWMSGFVNKQNMRYWNENNPQVIQELQMHPQRVTVWCGLWSGGIIGPYFFENQQRNAITVNGERYRAMITDFLWPELEVMNLDGKWFQQDATYHTSNVTMDLLEEKFGGSIISRNGPVNWPPRSCDLTPLDYFLWGYLKSLVYANKPVTTDDLKVNIEREIRAIQPDLLVKVVENWIHRMRICKRSRGGHLNDILFKS